MFGTVISLFLLKVAVAIITGSISIWAQAVDSSLDIFAAVITFLSVGFSTKPPDREHPFGHGKAENIAAGIQAVLLFGAASSIIYAAVLRLINGEVIKLTEAGIGVMLVSLVTSILLSRYLFKVGRATGSVALEASAHNLTGDIYSTAGVLVGLAVVRLTGLVILDPILAIIVSLLILRATYKVGRMAWGGLIDVRLPKEEEEQILTAIREQATQLVGFHDLRTRKAGSHRYIDLHLVVPRKQSVEKAHRLCDHLEKEIKNRLPNADVTIHVEPCSTECGQCPLPCELRQGKRN